jgi:hypothetical protein
VRRERIAWQLVVALRGKRLAEPILSLRGGNKKGIHTKKVTPDQRQVLIGPYPLEGLETGPLPIRAVPAACRLIRDRKISRGRKIAVVLDAGHARSARHRVPDVRCIEVDID